MRTIRNVAFALMAGLALVVGSWTNVSAYDECPPELKGECNVCVFTTPAHLNYHYAGCPESCSENAFICFDWCLGEDDCEDVGGGDTSGTCYCPGDIE
jgi:hypothetical protein